MGVFLTSQGCCWVKYKTRHVSRVQPRFNNTRTQNPPSPSKYTVSIFEEYNLESDDDHGQPSYSFSSLQAPDLMSLFNELVAQKWPTSFRMKSELDRYLEDELVPLSKDKFSVLDW
uniref:Uncharacterized protein n=1 Tax=Aegilops tauschii subsp. strangulata TaxID=200361 RepID=A0A453T9P3_AEGTS